MNKSNLTKLELENAINRIQKGETIRIPPTRKLSVRAVEDEANLGDGSAYYYKDVIGKIKLIANKSKTGTTITNSGSSGVVLREKLKKEINIKEKYRAEVKALKERLSLMTKTHNELALEVMMYKQRAEDLEGQLLLATIKK
ncbi:MAG: hypothetical protein V5789_03590 [Colwellia sp.]|jgi:ribosomal protein S17|tara:strand:- start:6875 stop:7300 length:426 start_codon:yes stop_codon:yes gene_type:complete